MLINMSNNEEIMGRLRSLIDAYVYDLNKLERLLPEVFLDMLGRRDVIQDLLEKIKNTPEYNELKKRVEEADNIFKEMLNKKEVREKYGIVNPDYRRKRHEWWWHPEKIIKKEKSNP